MDGISDFVESYDKCKKQRFKEVAGEFVFGFNGLSRQVHNNSKDKGFWEEKRNEGELIALMHSELSEALEHLRNGNPPDNHIPEFSGVEAEFADVIIRIMDIASAIGYRVAEAVVAKMEYNTKRPYKHGKSF